MKTTRPVRRLFSALTLTSVIGLMGCQADQSNVGSCTIESLSDGRSVLRCPDGSEHLLGQKLEGDGTCSVASDSHGIVTVTCPDSEPLVIDPSSGGVVGEATCAIVRETPGAPLLKCTSDAFRLDQACVDGFDGDLWLVGMSHFGGSFETEESYDFVDTESTSAYMVFQMLGCRKVNGNLRIAGWDRTQLPAAFEAIEAVGGDVIVEYNPELVGLQLPNLSTIGGGLRIARNAGLTSLEGLSSLVRVSSLQVYENEALGTCKAAKLRDALLLANPTMTVTPPPSGTWNNIGECP